MHSQVSNVQTAIINSNNTKYLKVVFLAFVKRKPPCVVTILSVFWHAHGFPAISMIPIVYP